MYKNTKTCIAIILSAFVACNSNSQTKQQQPAKQKIDIRDFSAHHQVLLTNEALFKGHSRLLGASAFLIRYEDSIYAVTARHLIGEAGGVKPEIAPDDLPRYNDIWIMYPRVQNDVAFEVITVRSNQFDYRASPADILLLPIKNDSTKITVLTPEFTLPQKNDSLFLLGCPYAEEDCRQNVYLLTYVHYDERSKLMVFTSADHVDKSGFSGAPIVDAYGHVVGELYGGNTQGSTEYVFATPIRGIRDIKRRY